MNFHIRELLGRIFSIFRKRKLDDDFKEELASHIAMATEDNIRTGMNSQEAHRQALIRFGGVEAARELHRDVRGLPLIENIALDTRYAFRMFLKNPGFSLAVIITLALCIGANTAIFSMLDALIFKPLPFPESDRIVSIYTQSDDDSNKRLSSIPQYLDFKENVDAFSHLALWQVKEFNLGIGDLAIRSSGATATPEIFDVLGLNPVLGRFFSMDNDLIDVHKEAVLTQSFWKTHFQEDPGIVGRTIQVDGEVYEVIGVAPKIFESFDAQPRFVIPMQRMQREPLMEHRYYLGFNLLGRLKPDATISAAAAQMTTLEKRAYAKVFPSIDREGPSIGMDTLQSSRIDPDLRMKLYLLQGAVLFVLLIGCVNVINLFLSRSNARQGELAVRIALGSGHRAIARQLLVESFLLTGLGTALGIALALGIIDMINVFTAQLLPKSMPFKIDGRMLSFTVIIAILTSLAIGLFQAIHVFGSNLLALTQNQSQRVSSSRSLRAMSSGLVIAQMAITLVLLIGGGLLIHSFANLLAVDSGFTSQQLTAARIALPGNYNRDNQDEKFRQKLKDSLREIPGFHSISLSKTAPYSEGSKYMDGKMGDSGMHFFVQFFSVDTSYLETMQIPLIEGRWFNKRDTNKSPRVCVVNQDYARQYFPGSSAVGKHDTFLFRDQSEIIGVVGSIRDISAEERYGRRIIPTIYSPMRQNTAPLWGINILIRSPRPVPEVISLLREKVKEIDPALPLYETGSMEGIISTSLNERRAIMMLLCSFAGIALILSAVGIYGVLAYDVSKRTHEIGIRGAIGATNKQIINMVLRQGLWKAGIGLLLGMAGAFYLSKFMTCLLFEVKPIDPLTFVLVPVLLQVVAILASYIPARQASRVDPALALRAE